MAGSLAHYWFMLRVVVPFGRGPGGLARSGPGAAVLGVRPGLGVGGFGPGR